MKHVVFHDLLLLLINICIVALTFILKVVYLLALRDAFSKVHVMALLCFTTQCSPLSERTLYFNNVSTLRLFVPVRVLYPWELELGFC